MSGPITWHCYFFITSIHLRRICSEWYSHSESYSWGCQGINPALNLGCCLRPSDSGVRGRKAVFTRLRPLNRLWRLPAIDSAYAYARARANIPKTKTITITSTPPPSHAQTYPESSGFPLPRVFGGKPGLGRSAAEIACPGEPDASRAGAFAGEVYPRACGGTASASGLDPVTLVFGDHLGEREAASFGVGATGAAVVAHDCLRS